MLFHMLSNERGHINALSGDCPRDLPFFQQFSHCLFPKQNWAGEFKYSERPV